MSIFLFIFLSFFGVYNSSYADDLCNDVNNIYEAANDHGFDLDDPAKIVEFFPLLKDECQLTLLIDSDFHVRLGGAISDLQGKLDNYQRLNDSEYEALIKLHGIQSTTLEPKYVERQQSAIRAEKKNCATKDQRSKMPPVRDQDTKGWCYSYTAADLVSYKAGKNISAFDMALTYNKHENNRAVADSAREFIRSIGIENGGLKYNSNAFSNLSETVRKTTDREGGNTDVAIEKSALNGFCLEEDFPSDSYESSTLGGILNSLEIMDGMHTSLRRGNASDQEIAEFFCQTTGNKAIELVDNLLLEDIIEVLKSPHFTNYAERLQKIACKDRIEVKGEIAYWNAAEYDQVELYDYIDSLLDEDEILGISYNTEMAGDNPEDAGDHASTIVGRQWNESSKQCEYIIRNSWGPNCDSYPAGMRCEGGYFWVTKDDLKQHVFSIETFL